MKITEEQYNDAVVAHAESQKTINLFHRQRQEAFDARIESGEAFKDEELVYSARSLCPCGHGLAHPKDCGPRHYWDCSAILKGEGDKGVEHIGQMPFYAYTIKSEDQPSANGLTTRGAFKPKLKE